MSAGAPRSIERRRLLAGAAAATTLQLCVGGAAIAQGYPARTIRIVVPWPPGGLVDSGGRIIAEALTQSFGQAAVVENVPGAAGNLGASQVAKAAPDGYTLLMGTSSIAIDVAGGRRVAFDPQKDIVPVALVADTNSVIIVPAGSAIRSLADLVAAGKAKPDDLSYGTPGIGSPAHLFGELFAQTAGIRMLHVPYSRSPAMNDLIGGRLSVMFATIPVALPQISNAQVRPLAVTGTARFPALPDVPTVAEAGLPGYSAGQWLGVFAPAGTSPDIVLLLNAEITRALKKPAVAKQLQQRGMSPLTATPSEFAKIFSDDVAKWRTVIRSANITLE